MRYKSLLLVSVLMAASSALADTATMNFIGPGGNNSGGVYTYPYNFSINGGPSTALICDTFDNDVTSGETWSANVSGLLSGNGLFGNDTVDYKAAGLIFQNILAGTTDANDGNWAIWSLFSQTAFNSAFFQGNTNAKNIYNNALASAPNAADGVFDGLVIYTPIAGTQTLNGHLWGGLPQEYIGRVAMPEPGAFSMIGFTICFLLFGFVMRKPLGLNLAARQMK